jgi:hypothetical protein
MRRKPNSFFARGARPRADDVGIVEFGGHVVRRNDAVAQRGSGDFALGANNSGCANWPGERIALPGMAPWWALTKSIRPKSMDSTWGRAAICQTSCSAPGVSIRTWTGISRSMLVPSADFVEGRYLRQRVVGAGDLGQHDVGDPLSGAADNDFEVGAPVRMGDVVDAGAEASVAIRRIQQQAGDHGGVFGLAAGRGAISQSAVTSNTGRSSIASSVCSCKALRMVLFRTGVSARRRRAPERAWRPDTGRRQDEAAGSPGPARALRFILAPVISRGGWRRRLALPAVRPGSCPSWCASSHRWPGLRRACIRRSSQVTGTP